MPVPTWLPGYQLQAADVNSWMVPLGAYKLNVTQLASTTVQAADPDLEIAFPSNGIWIIESVIRYRGPAANSLSWGWQTSSPSISGSVAALYYNSSGTLTQDYHPWTYTGDLAQTQGTGTDLTLRISGLVAVGGAGALAFAWAQGSSSATNTSVEPGSYLMGWRAN